MYNNSGRIELLNNTEVIINTYLHLLQNANRRCDYFADVRSLSVVPFAFEAIKKAMLESKATRATRLRFITEITKANISYCKNLMKYVEMHHLDGSSRHATNILDRLDVTYTYVLDFNSVMGPKLPLSVIRMNVYFEE
jgi:hypothetical protein